MKNISGGDTKVTKMVVAVKESDPAEKLEDAASYQFGVQYALQRSDVEAAVANINEKLGSQIAAVEYGSVAEQAAALHSGEVQAIIYNDAYSQMLEEGLGEEQENFKVIYTYEVKSKVENKAAQVEVKDETFTVYISGIDVYGAIETNSRSDVNILAVVNPNTHQVLLVTTPRDYYVPLTISGGVRDKLTHAGIYGVDVSRGTLENLYNTEIPYYLRMNFSGFINIIDALGGVDVYSSQSFSAGGVSFQEGYNHVNGTQALAFARERHSFASGDRQRGKNQMEVIRATIKKCQSSSMLTNYQQVMQSLSGTFQTNLEQDRIAQLVSAQLFEKSDWNVVSYSVDGTGSSRTTYSMQTAGYVMFPMRAR